MTTTPKSANPDPVKLCQTCFHYHMKLFAETSAVGNQAEGKCHRFPPKATLIASPTGHPITATYWPGPKPTESCGEWKARLKLATTKK